jgi:hypothetical protein
MLRAILHRREDAPNEFIWHHILKKIAHGIHEDEP